MPSDTASNAWGAGLPSPPRLRKTTPQCIICHGKLDVRALPQRTNGTRYWTCDNCAVAWATRDESDSEIAV